MAIAPGRHVIAVTLCCALLRRPFLETAPMKNILTSSWRKRLPDAPWNGTTPVREELFGVERLEQHAESLARAQRITRRPPPVLSLQARLNSNATVLLAAYRAAAQELESGHGVVPAAEWLLDNYHVVEEQIREIRDDLPPGYYRQLPKLADGPFAGYPRVFGLTWAFVAHTDSHFDPDTLRRYIDAYQRVQPLTIGELWAVAITLRIVLIENLRRLADQISLGRRKRADADALADRLIKTTNAATGSQDSPIDPARNALETDALTRSPGPLSELFAAQLAKRLRGQDPRTTPALGWLQDRLARQGATAEEAIRHAQQRQGASNVTVRNVITSMRLISTLDWTELFETVSTVDARLRQGSAFADMDFTTRDLYRAAIEALARGSSASELDVVEKALQSAEAAGRVAIEPNQIIQRSDPGHHLVGGGRTALEKAIGFRPTLRLRWNRFNTGMGIKGYASAIASLTAVLLVLALFWLADLGLGPVALTLFALIGLLPASEAATALINRGAMWQVGPAILPGLALRHGVPAPLRTLIAVPTLLTSREELLANLERLEVHHLSGASGDLVFALVSDGVDADVETLESDAELLALALTTVDTLNQRYGLAPCGERFIFLHRRRVFNRAQGSWMGWERKRGKLHELNRLLRGASDTTFMTIAGRAPSVPAGVRYVITLDSDTRLPRDAATRMIGKMAHPLNRPHFAPNDGRSDPDVRRVTSGYAILQPRVTPALPMGREGSLYQRLFSAPGGMDPYATAVSDVYQDLFGEGSYTGKGIYDIDAFELALASRVPENTMLSHDLFEGDFARAGLASDIEVVDDAPSRYDVAAKRQHRWTRGDWQLLPWLAATRPGYDGVSLIGRWKMLDNLRRSLHAPATWLALVVAALLPTPAAAGAMFLIIAFTAVPSFLHLLFSLRPPRAGITWDAHLRRLGGDLRMAAQQTAFALTMLADQAWRMIDAIVRTLYRLYVSHRNMLEWTTAAQTMLRPKPGVAGSYRDMAGGLVLTLAFAVIVVLFRPQAWPYALPWIVVWLCAPALAFWASRAPAVSASTELSDTDATDLRLIARRTWHFFETFVTPADNMLPPDNFQEDPKPAVAHRTSPTNIGLYLLSTVAARDFGWCGMHQTVERLEATLTTMQKLARHRGHFFNWYDTEDLRALAPAYVSSVDSGNLAGHLITLANACDMWRTDPATDGERQGLLDTLTLARIAFDTIADRRQERARQLNDLLDDIETSINGPQTLDTLLPGLKRLTEKAAAAARDLLPPIADQNTPELLVWTHALCITAHELERDHVRAATPRLAERLLSIAATARALAMEMDFAFLLDPERKLLSIGFSVVDDGLDANCYDLLASEARLASLFAIAKGDVPTRHWFRLGRTATPIEGGSALISWSGSMFEYLMPSLIMRAPAGSLLEQTNRLVVARQITYGQELGIPWGVSESAFNARDMAFTYQYSNFGVPGLGLKRGLASNAVIAPYATGLAAMVAPAQSCRNFQRMASLGALGAYGFYEALDFTPIRLPEGEAMAIVRNYMAHHQGMTIVAIANIVHAARMRARFHNEPMIQACELLLQERMPRNVAMAPPRAEEVKASPDQAAPKPPAVRRITGPQNGAPLTHILSNGRYSVMLTSTAAGYSQWHDQALTRWREDATRDHWGAFIYLRDTDSNQLWRAGAPATAQTGGAAQNDAVIFGEDYAEFTHHDATMSTTLDVLVSGEDDGEVRRVSLLNSGKRPREIEITSYAEIVLASATADNAHPAFSKLFVVTEHLPEYDALTATRRPREHDESSLWAAHFAVVEATTSAAPQFDTNRATFIDRARTPATSASIATGRPLAGSTGTVLDPIFALRQRVIVAPGKCVRVAFWTVVAPNRAELLHMIDKHHDRSAYARARTLAWTQAQVQLRHLDIDAEEAADFQRLGAAILYADRRFRAPSELIARGAGPKSGLWPLSISGDLPIVLLRVDDIDDIGQVQQFLRAHEYWRMKRLAVDLVIINERASSYIQDLQGAIDMAVRSSQSRPNFGETLAQGSIYALRADLISGEARALLQSVARIALIARRGNIAAQLATIKSPAPRTITPAPARARPTVLPTPRENDALRATLSFFNGTGGFDKNGTEYVTILEDGKTTPAPWINVIANPGFGFHVSAQGQGYTWSGNSRENMLTPWSNDPVCDTAGEAIYLRDEESGHLWCPTAGPIQDNGTYIARHGHGYSQFEHQTHGIESVVRQYVPAADPVKITRISLRNLDAAPRRIQVTVYAEWVMGSSREANGPFLITSIDPATSAMLVSAPWNMAFAGRVGFCDLGGQQTTWTGDRAEFLGYNGRPAAPAGLGQSQLSGTVGAGFDPCAAMTASVMLAPFGTAEVIWLLGEAESPEAARAVIVRQRAADQDAVLGEVTDQWKSVLGAVQVKTPDAAMDVMLNGWLLYQTLACRVWARSAFYQASGAYGFRDQLQDGMALTFALPAATREHIVRAAGRQFVEGDVQHWWLPHSGQGVRTRISDDRVWLAYATATYVATSGDAAILEEDLPFLDGRELAPDEHDAFYQPMVSELSASLFEHCARGLDQCVALTGQLGMPLMGTGDWNDGMNRVGAGGQGESVWLGWLFIRTVALFAPLADKRDPARAQRWRAHAQSVTEAIETHAWDGQWYRRATFDDGSWLGSADSEACRIDSIAQSWAVLSGAAAPDRAALAMTSLEHHLIRRDDAMALLFTPPFDAGAHDPGYIKGYPPGLRENGGQYSHAAMWAILAYAKMGQGARAVELFGLLNPINHSSTPTDASRYKVEPYVVAADVYSVAPHIGRGGWTWYTGSAGWMYRAGVEGILGLRREGTTLVLSPCLPAAWPGFEATITLGLNRYAIRVVNAPGQARHALLDGQAVALDAAGALQLHLDEKGHTVELYW